MPDLLAHALLAYSIGTLLAWRSEWITPAYVTVVMAGAFVPDLTKVQLLLPGELVGSVLGVPFDWFALHTGGGALVSVLVGVLAVVPHERRRAFALLSIGAGSHLLADAFLRTATGYAYPVLWPLTRSRPPTPGLYLSTQYWPTIAAALLAAVAWALTSDRGRAALGIEERRG